MTSSFPNTYARLSPSDAREGRAIVAGSPLQSCASEVLPGAPPQCGAGSYILRLGHFLQATPSRDPSRVFDPSKSLHDCLQLRAAAWR